MGKITSRKMLFRQLTFSVSSTCVSTKLGFKAHDYVFPLLCPLSSLPILYEVVKIIQNSNKIVNGGCIYFVLKLKLSGMLSCIQAQSILAFLCKRKILFSSHNTTRCLALRYSRQRDFKEIS